MTVRNLDALLRPARLWFLGPPDTEALAGMRTRLLALPDGPAVLDIDGPLPEVAAGDGALLAVIAHARHGTAATVARLGELGCRALIWPLADPPPADALDAARRFTLRILGPRSVGLARSASHLDVSLLAQTPQPGTLALVVQSQSIAAAAVDWAAGRGIGFSWVAVTGGEADVDIADLLDYAALDPATQAVAVEVGRIRGARKFMSAARACARAKPTVILQTRQVGDEAIGADPVRSAAFARAGLVEVPTLPGLFDALAALQRLPKLDRPRVLVAANGAALCALMLDAAVRQGLEIAGVPEPARAALLLHAPAACFPAGAVDLGDPAPDAWIASLHLLLDVPGVDVVVFVRSPVAGHPHEPMAQALIHAQLGPRLLPVWLGLESALPARHLTAAAGLSTFTSPDAAARAVRYRYEYTRNRELLTQTPPHHALPDLDMARTADRLADAQKLHGADAEVATRDALLEAYELPSVSLPAPDALALEVRLRRHPELGMVLAIQVRCPGLVTRPAFAFPPLDPLIAARLLSEAGLVPRAGGDAGDLAAAGQLLIRMGQMAMDQPCVARMEAVATLHEGHASLLPGVHLELESSLCSERDRLALAPYPSRHEHVRQMGDGEPYRLRAVRPSDEPGVIGLLQSLDPESIRLRFFSHMRYFSHAMAARMTQVDYDRELVLVACRESKPDALVAIGTIIADPDGARAEFALVVHQGCVGIGLGRHLLERLLAHAREQKIGVVYGEVLRENAPMLGLARRLGFVVQRDPDEPGCFRVEQRTG